MKQKYILYILFSLILSINGLAQEKKNNNTKTDNIEGLQIFPNPVTNGRIFITTENNSTAIEVELYDMLGKLILKTTLLNNREINVSNLNAGVYMIKIKEQNNSSTRKLVIK